MLKSLYIKNYALIDSLEIDFFTGFSVITGETGAGKSILLGALSLILGQRADAKSIKQGESKCIIEGVFDIEGYSLQRFFSDHEIDYEVNCILRRELLASGKSRAFINDTPVTLNDLKELGSQLIDIHSQHQNLLLSDKSFQLNIVDLLAGNQESLKSYRNIFGEYKYTERELHDLRETAQREKEEEEYVRFQYDTLKEANLRDGEQEELEEELDALNHTEDIKSALFKIHTLLSDDDGGIVTSLKEALGSSHSLSDIFKPSEEISERINSAYVDMQDLSREVERMSEDVEFSPERLNQIETKLDTIYTLLKKHNKRSVSELLQLKDEYAKKLEYISSSDDKIEELEKILTLKAKEVSLKAAEISKKRISAKGKLETDLVDKVVTLGMPNVRFECRITPKGEPDISGADNITFLFSANKNATLQPVSEIASGGEISRLMLCLKSLIAGATALPSIIFDEIDTGVSGEVADRMGQIMQEFGRTMQVIAITHLPQIAAKGATHYFVYKTDEADTTVTNLRELSEQERIEETARMLSGTHLTDAAIANAKEMLKQSGTLP